MATKGTVSDYYQLIIMAKPLGEPIPFPVGMAKETASTAAEERRLIDLLLGR